MKQLTVHDSVLSGHQRQLVGAIHARVPLVTIHIHYGLDLAQLSALGVTIPRNGRRPEDAQLETLWRAVPDRTSGFLVVVGKSALRSDPALLTTVGHELEHVRQELDCPGILKLSETCLAFIEATPSIHTVIPSPLHAPVNAHAEIAGALSAVELLGLERVRHYYESAKPRAMPIVQGVVEGATKTPGDAAGDLAAFFRAHWSEFEAWHKKTVRPRLCSLAEIRAFIDDPCSSNQAAAPAR